MITPNIIALIKKHEGCSLVPYSDSMGFSTIGFGHLCRQDEDFSNGITQDQADLMCLADISTAYGDALSLFPKMDGICEARQAVLVDIAFNLGRQKLSHFVNFIAAVIAERWVQAAYELRNSLWYNQVGDRGIEDRLIILTGEFQ